MDHSDFSEDDFAEMSTGHPSRKKSSKFSFSEPSKKHLDGTVIQRKTIQLRIEPSSVTSGSFCIDGKVSIDDNVFCVNSKKSHYLRITSMPSAQNSFKVKLKTSGDQLISRAMVTCLPDSVATSLSSNLGSSSFRKGFIENFTVILSSVDLTFTFIKPGQKR